MLLSNCNRVIGSTKDFVSSVRLSVCPVKCFKSKLVLYTSKTEQSLKKTIFKLKMQSNAVLTNANKHNIKPQECVWASYMYMQESDTCCKVFRHLYKQFCHWCAAQQKTTISQPPVWPTSTVRQVPTITRIKPAYTDKDVGRTDAVWFSSMEMRNALNIVALYTPNFRSDIYSCGYHHTVTRKNMH